MAIQAKYREFLFALGFIALGFVVYFGNTFSQFSEAIFYFTDPDDIRTVSWNTWHFSEMLRNSENPFYTDLLLYPEGSSLLMHASTPFFGLLNLIFNNVALSVNVGIAINFIGMGLGFYYLSKRWLVTQFAALAVAFVAVFNSYYLAKIGVHINLTLMVFVPWLILLLLKTISHDGSRFKLESKVRLAAFILLLFLQLFFDLYAIFFTLSFVALFVIYHSFQARIKSWPTWLKLTSSLTIILVGHVASRLMKIEGLEDHGAFWAAPDIMNVLVPGNNSKFFAGIDLAQFPLAENDHKMFLGYALFALLILALAVRIINKKKVPTAGFVAFACVVLLFVSLPIWKLNGKVYLYSFTGIIHFIPFVNNVRAPDRFIALVFWLLPLLCFMLLEANMNIKKSWFPIICALFAGLSTFDFRMEEKKADVQGRANRYDPVTVSQEAPILLLPFGMRDGFQHFGEFDTKQLLDQQAHALPLYSGYLSRISDKKWELARANTLLSSLVLLQNGDSLLDQNLVLHSEFERLGIEEIGVDPEYLEEHPALKSQLDSWVKSSQLNLEKSDKFYYYSTY